MNPDQYRREGADVMRAACIHAVNATASPIVGTPYSAGGRAFSDAIRAIDVDDVLARLPPAHDAMARLVGALRHIAAYEPSEKHNGNRNDLIAHAAVETAIAAIRAIDVDEVLVGLPGRAGSSEAAWQDVTALPDPKEGPFMVSNLPNAVNSHGRPSHVFCVISIHKDEDGSFCAFDGYRKIWGITRYYPISSPALPQETTNDQ